jgi:hypothetical protein
VPRQILLRPARNVRTAFAEFGLGVDTFFDCVAKMAQRLHLAVLGNGGFADDQGLRGPEEPVLHVTISWAWDRSASSHRFGLPGGNHSLRRYTAASCCTVTGSTSATVPVSTSTRVVPHAAPLRQAHSSTPTTCSFRSRRSRRARRLRCRRTVSPLTTMPSRASNLREVSPPAPCPSPSEYRQSRRSDARGGEARPGSRSAKIERSQPGASVMTRII